MRERAAARGGGEMHQADRLVGAAAAGTGDAGDGDDDIGAGFVRARRAPWPPRFRGSPRRASRNVSAGTPSICCLAAFE